MDLSKITKVGNILKALKTAFGRIVSGKCIVCGECKEHWDNGDICANRDCEKCPLN